MTKFEEKVLDMVPNCPEPPDWYVYEQLKNRGYATKMTTPADVMFEIDLEFRIEFAKKLLIKMQGKE